MAIGRIRVIESIPDFSGLRMLVAGDAMLDEYWFGDTDRISPEAPVPVVRTRKTESRPGGAANVALNLAVLGAHSTLCAVVGADEQADRLRAALEAAGVTPAFAVVDGVKTSHKLRVLARSQQLIRLDAEEDLSGAAEAFGAQFAKQVERCDTVILSDYGKGTLARAPELIASCRRLGKPVLIDPKGTDFSRYRGATVLTPNQSEFFAVVGTCPDEPSFERRGEALRAELELEALLVTRGHKGMTLSLSAQAREVFDVTGAGDTVIATMAAALAADRGYEEAAALANLAAGVVIGKIGVASVSRAELRFALHRRGSGGRGVLTLDELADVVGEAQARGERVVMTNGCFDILHAGHVAYLEEAKSLGDRLVVAVNDDESVRRLKGPERPIVPLADRMSVLGGLAAVDWVVPFEEDTPLRVVERILPDVLVKGGDWRPDQIVGSDVVLRNGGQVRSLQFKPGRSTTNVIAAIRNAAPSADG
jgi:D-beta-D-heptose 7-phosphate kinase/D-beta-D-heptose 1-phosphate adenosyltransferase